jgi:hypothetical protein
MIINSRLRTGRHRCEDLLGIIAAADSREIDVARGTTIAKGRQKHTTIDDEP